MAPDTRCLIITPLPSPFILHTYKCYLSHMLCDRTTFIHMFLFTPLLSLFGKAAQAGTYNRNRTGADRSRQRMPFATMDPRTPFPQAPCVIPRQMYDRRTRHPRQAHDPWLKRSFLHELRGYVFTRKLKGGMFSPEKYGRGQTPNSLSSGSILASLARLSLRNLVLKDSDLATLANRIPRYDFTRICFTSSLRMLGHQVVLDLFMFMVFLISKFLTMFS